MAAPWQTMHMDCSVANSMQNAQTPTGKSTILEERVKILPYIRTMAKYRNNSMLLLTNCEVYTGKYLDRSFEVRTERSEVRTKS